MHYVGRVRVKAFKSVGGEWIELSFEKGLNAIVGKRRAQPALGTGHGSH